MNDNHLGIAHNPLGNEQPYFQQTFERFPRYPLAGEPISFGAVTSPMDGAESVELLWRPLDSTAGFTSAAAVCIGTSDSVGNSGCDRYWLASIPPQTEGSRIEYWFRASTGETGAETRRFQFSVGSLCSYNRIVASGTEKETLYFELGSDDSDTPLLCAVTHRGQSVHTEFVLGRTIPASAEQAGFPSAEGCSIEIVSGKTKVILDSFAGYAYEVGKAPYREVSFSIKAESGEKFFGFGERYNRLDQRGEILQNRVFEQYCNQRLKSYMPVPFFQSSRGYGVSLETERNVHFDLCAGDGEKVAVRAETGSDAGLSGTWYFGTPKEVQSAFSGASLSSLRVPEWALGPWMSSNEWNSQQRVLSEVKKGDNLDIPVSVIVIEAWSDEATFYIWNDAEYLPKPADQPMRLDEFTFPEAGRWPDPKGMIDKLHAQGRKLVLWQIPVVKEFENNEDTPEQQRLDQVYAEEKGLCLREEDGSAYRVRPGWFSHSRVPDLASRAGREWWFSKRAYLMEEMGVDGFKTDGGEHLWGYTVRCSEAYEKEFRDSVSGDRLINRFPLSYISAYHEAMEKHLHDRQALTFSRAGYAGAGRYPCHWTGDQGSSWEACRRVLTAVINANISGIPIIGWDIGGFSGEIPTAELYLRSAAAALFSPVMQYHSENNDHKTPHVDRTPWNIAECRSAPEVIDLYRMFAKLRMAIIPYISAEIQEVRLSGLPLVRPLWIDAPEDRESWEIEDSYRFGRTLLVAPVLFEGARERNVYLPPGLWEDVWTGEKVKGGQTLVRETPLSQIPVFRDLDKPWPLSPTLFRDFYLELQTRCISIR